MKELGEDTADVERKLCSFLRGEVDVHLDKRCYLVQTGLIEMFKWKREQRSYNRSDTGRRSNFLLDLRNRLKGHKLG